MELTGPATKSIAFPERLCTCIVCTEPRIWADTHSQEDLGPVYTNLLFAQVMAHLRLLSVQRKKLKFLTDNLFFPN